jgi:hypothetical protein
MSSAAPLHQRLGKIIFAAGNTVVSLVKILVSSRKTPEFPGPGSDTCIVLGNGPSLKTSFQKYPGHFERFPLICVNSFCLSPEYDQLKPGYCVMLDSGLWKADNEFVQNVLNALLTKTTWTMHLIIPHDAAGSALLRNLNNHAHIRIHLINYVVFKGFSSVGHYFYKKNLAMPQCQNVLVASLFCAINLGFSKIEFFGADHNWHEQLAVREDNVVCIRQVHFYENREEVSFLPFYKTMHVKETFRMDEAFHAWAKVFHGYFNILNYATSRSVKIVNSSEVSFIDAFERSKPTVI